MRMELLFHAWGGTGMHGVQRPGAGDLQDMRITLREGEKGIHFPAGSRTQSKHRLRCGALLP